MDVRSINKFLGISRDSLNEAMWSGKVKTKWHPPEGFFKQSAGDIASGLKKASKDLSQAVSRLNFYKNRAGKNLSSKEMATLDAALKKLRGMYEGMMPHIEENADGDRAIRFLLNSLGVKRRGTFMYRGDRLLTKSMNEIATVVSDGKTFDIVVKKTGEKHDGVSEDEAVAILVKAIDKGPW